MALGPLNNSNDTPIGSNDYRGFVDPTLSPADGDTLIWRDSVQAYVAQPGVTTAGFKATDDAGDGSVEGDVNATDYSGQSPVIGQAADLQVSSINTFVHKEVAYNWIGPTGVTVGIGGTYTATADDFAGIGTADHDLLVNVSPDDHHNEMHDHSDGDPSGRVSHRDIINRSEDFCHPTQAITGLDDDQAQQDQNLVDHNNDVDAHNNLFSVAAYGGVNRSAPVAFDVTTGWTTLPLDQGLLANPRGITQVPGSNAIRLDYNGVYKLEIGGIIQGHNSSNGGRTFFLRLYNNTEGAPISQDLAIGVGRNTEDTDFSFGTLFEVEGAAIGDDIIVQIGNGDAITGGTLTGGQLATFMIGEWRG